MILDGAEIAAATGGRLLRDGPHGPVATDSRTIAAGSWFLALAGERFDAHDYLADVATKGVAGCVVSREPPADWPGGIVLVDDTARALRDLGRAARDRLRCPVIGLTGSSGKTTTRALCALAVGGLGKVHQTVGNLNNQLGVPMTLLAAPDDADVAVVELGTSLPGEIAILSEIVRPTVRLIVNIGPAHLEELGGLEGVAQEKGALFATARPGDFLCINVDDPFVRAMPRPEGTHLVTYGEDPAATVCLVEVRVDAEAFATAATVRTPSGSLSFRLPIPGRHVAHDATAALAVAYALGLDLRAAAQAMERYEPVGMRMRAEPLPGGALAINDAYNANPGSMAASLEVLAALGGRRVAVLGDMFELGADELRWHRDVAALAGRLGLDLVVLTGPRMASVADACVGARELWVEPDPDAVAARLGSWLRSGDRVLFKASRGARVERILQTLLSGGPN